MRHEAIEKAAMRLLGERLGQPLNPLGARSVSEENCDRLRAALALPAAPPPGDAGEESFDDAALRCAGENLASHNIDPAVWYNGFSSGWLARVPTGPTPEDGKCPEHGEAKDSSYVVGRPDLWLCGCPVRPTPTPTTRWR